MKTKVSVTIISLNEERCIARAIRSVSWADEVIVVDSGSTDRTVEIAKNLNAKVTFNSWPGYGQQKNFAQDLAKNDWVLNLDADEIISPALFQEIQRSLDQPDSKSGKAVFAYSMPRKTFFMGEWIRHGGWYPNDLVRLANRKHTRWTEPRVHEQLILKTSEGVIGRISEPILHEAFLTIDDQIHTNLRFAKLGSEEIRRKHPTREARSVPNFLRLLFKPLWKFIDAYLLKMGFLDGLRGLIIASNAAHSMFLKYAFLLTSDAADLKSKESSHVKIT